MNLDLSIKKWLGKLVVERNKKSKRVYKIHGIYKEHERDCLKLVTTNIVTKWDIVLIAKNCRFANDKDIAAHIAAKMLA